MALADHYDELQDAIGRPRLESGDRPIIVDRVAIVYRERSEHRAVLHISGPVVLRDGAVSDVRHVVSAYLTPGLPAWLQRIAEELAPEWCKQP